MTKHEFMKEMERSLNALPSEERNEILQDFEEHFAIGLAEGKREEEIADALGSPDQIAREMNANRHISTANKNASFGNMVRATWAVIGLSFFNIIVVLGPFVAIVGIILSGWITSGAFIIAPLLAILGILAGGSNLFDFSVSIALCGIGLLLWMLMIRLTRWFTIGFTRYLQFNMSLVKGGMKHEKI
ncbi:DUF1700 domain-containing protein [Aciduricibacillus chroicocephali]|uniref:DUF1700 domain-containing protein n=1 Tax=Aciduricibacillus chroicocephali TaxID=3054939 RepID=A0ABY9KWE2_9BACI|nr:DUF1700 domain-containing protein [Bacillaceae bacterium 44XB]